MDLPPVTPLDPEASDEALRDGAELGFDRPGPVAIAVDGEVCVEGGELSIEVPEPSEPAPVDAE